MFTTKELQQIYEQIMRNAKEDMYATHHKNFYPSAQFIRNKTRRERMEELQKVAYDKLVMLHMEHIPKEAYIPLTSYVQKQDFRSLIKVIIGIIACILIAGGLIFWNYDRWEAFGFGTIVFGAAFAIVVFITQRIFVTKKIGDAIIRFCLQNQKEKVHC